MVLGGMADSTITVSWPKGGGEDLSRWVTYGDSTRLDCRIFSFDPLPRKVSARLYRLKPGIYKVSLSRDENGFPGGELSVQRLRLSRFDTIDLSIPSKIPVLLSIQQESKLRDPGQLPDLAVADYDCKREGKTLSIRISNLGAVVSSKAALCIYDESGRKIAGKGIPIIQAPGDYVEKSVWVQIDTVPEKGRIKIVVDPQNCLNELFKGNNTAIVE
jgi:hypothetical protein